ncbi:MAG TPA: GGDEF domain-containing protein, partial [Woeseiaceae bacterium]|nr:GGDEF domain-containing protein [Woeseiaceae bacterium]
MIYAIDRCFGRMPECQLVIWCLLQILFLGIMDWLTGFELSFAVFYLVPVSVAAWYGTGTTTYGVALVATGMWFVVEYATDYTYSAQWILYWNSAVRLVFFGVVAFLICQLRSHVESQQRLARTDHLTGLLNRAGFMELSEVLASSAARYDLSLVIGFIDLDGFKKVNDTLGHYHGDEVLKTVGETMTQMTRESDISARLGGDEFAVLLPNTDLDGARAYFGKLHLELLDAMRRHGGSDIGVSIGAVVFERGPPPLDEALRLADDLMYRAKKSGRTSVLVEPPPGVTPLRRVGG